MKRPLQLLRTIASVALAWSCLGCSAKRIPVEAPIAQTDSDPLEDAAQQADCARLVPYYRRLPRPAFCFNGSGASDIPLLRASAQAQAVAEAESFLAMPEPPLKRLRALAERMKALTRQHLQSTRELLAALSARDAASYRRSHSRSLEIREWQSALDQVVTGACPKELPSTTARLPPELIQATVRNNFPKFRGCFEAGLARNPRLAGRVVLHFVIGETGRVQSASAERALISTRPECVPDPEAVEFFAELGHKPAESTSFPDGDVVQCMVEAVRRLTFPRPRDKVTVVYPINLQPDEPAQGQP